MARPHADRIICWLCPKPYRKKNGTCVWRFRYQVRDPGAPTGYRQVQVSVPQEVASNSRHRTHALRYMLQYQTKLNLRAADPAEAVTLGEAAERYFEHQSPRWRPRSEGEIRWLIGRFVTRIGPDVPLAAVTRETVTHYLDDLLNVEGVAHASYNHHAKMLRAFFNRLRKAFGYLSENPADGVQLLDGADQRPKVVLTDEQAARVVLEAVSRNRPYGLGLWVMAETGIRTGAMLSREWEHLRRVPHEGDDVARIGVVLLAGDTKGKRARVPPLLTTELSIEVDAHRTELQLDGRCTGFAFRPWQERPRGMWRQPGDSVAATSLRRLLRDVCRDLDLPEITPHGFRRIVATTLEELNVPTEAIQETVGWRGRGVIERHYIGRGVLEQRAVQKAREVADVRGFGTTIAKVRAEGR